VIRAGSTTAGAITDRLGLPRRTVSRRLATLVERELITRASPPHSGRQSYLLVDLEEG
jgi:ATP-dependent DNA helicase RecG